MRRRTALLVLASGGAGLGLMGYALRRGGRAPKPTGVLAGGPRPSPFPADPGSLSQTEKQLLWQLAVATGAPWNLSELSEKEFLGFLELKTQSPPSYLAEYRNALEVFASACREHSPPEAVVSILRHAGRERTAEHARDFVIGEFIALHLATGGFRQFGLTRFRAYVGEGYRASPVQPGRLR